jgi:hypothetical protein
MPPNRIALARMPCPKFPKPSKKDMERILKEDPSKIEKNEMTLWNVKLAENPLTPADEVIMTRTRCISAADGLEIEKNHFKITKKNYAKLVQLNKLKKWLKDMHTTQTISPDEGIELVSLFGQPIGHACGFYHAFLKDNFSGARNREFLRQLNLLKYEYDQ